MDIIDLQSDRLLAVGCHMSRHACSIRLLTIRDARLSYALIMLRQPSLSLKRWQGMLRANGGAKTARLFGVLTPMGYLMAIIRVKDIEVEFLAEPPPLLGDPCRILEAVAACSTDLRI